MKDIFTPADILLPKDGTDMTKWTVVACDQFSSEPEWWEEFTSFSAGEPSAVHMMLPEAYLHYEDVEERKESIYTTMKAYERDGVFKTVENSFIYIERSLPNGKVRRGLLGKLDLEAYDWHAGSKSPVRSTEATVPERLPTRVELRKKTPLEMPHIVLFIDDPDDKVLSDVEKGEKLYDFSLYGNGGAIAGWRVSGSAAATLQDKLNSLPEDLAFAMGDGNHSLAAAKNRWEELKASGAPMDHPARWALAEMENVRDDAVDFYPIHRVLFGTDEGGFIKELTEGDTGNLVAEADRFCTEYIAAHGGTVDYVHGDEAACRMGSQEGCAAVILPTLPKAELFDHIRKYGNYPKKSFSVGKTLDKRWYLECRKIVP